MPTPTPTHAQVIEATLQPNADAAVREQTLRLVNLFASESAGRSYLLMQVPRPLIAYVPPSVICPSPDCGRHPEHHLPTRACGMLTQPSLIDILCEILTSEPADSIARQNCLGALQKLSLRRQPQNTMIDFDVIAWLVQQLADIDALSQYSVEYGTALLMNLSLRSAGKSKCTQPDLDILSVLSQLMESDSMQVRTYVNGTLYSILMRASLKARAAEIGLPDSLKALIEHSDETFARQVRVSSPYRAPPHSFSHCAVRVRSRRCLLLLSFA